MRKFLKFRLYRTTKVYLMIVFNIRHDGRIGLNSLEIREVSFLIAHPNVLDK